MHISQIACKCSAIRTQIALKLKSNMFHCEIQYAAYMKLYLWQQCSQSSLPESNMYHPKTWITVPYAVRISINKNMYVTCRCVEWHVVVLHYRQAEVSFVKRETGKITIIIKNVLWHRCCSCYARISLPSICIFKAWITKVFTIWEMIPSWCVTIAWTTRK